MSRYGGSEQFYVRKERAPEAPVRRVRAMFQQLIEWIEISDNGLQYFLVSWNGFKSFEGI